MEFTVIDANVIRSHCGNKVDDSRDDTDQLIAKFKDIECLDLSCLSEYMRGPCAVNTILYYIIITIIMYIVLVCVLVCGEK